MPPTFEVFEIVDVSGRRTYAACEAHDTLPTGVVHAWQFDAVKGEWYCDRKPITDQVMVPAVVAALYLHHGSILDQYDPQARWSAAFVCGECDHESGRADMCFAFLRAIGGAQNLNDRDVKAYERGRKQAIEWQKREKEFGPYETTFHVKRAAGSGEPSLK